MSAEKYRVTLTFEKPRFHKHMESVIPNMDRIIGRAVTNFKENENSFQIYIEARDTVAVRAALGSVTKWILIANRIIEEVN
ncbi:MAG: KEOPS complex subunit Pcc1 [Cuniculiplasma sp.]